MRFVPLYPGSPRIEQLHAQLRVNDVDVVGVVDVVDADGDVVVADVGDVADYDVVGDAVDVGGGDVVDGGGGDNDVEGVGVSVDSRNI